MGFISNNRGFYQTNIHCPSSLAKGNKALCPSGESARCFPVANPGKSNELIPMSPHQIPSMEANDSTRRRFLGLGAGTAASLVIPKSWATADTDHPALAEALSRLQYLTADKDFRYVGRIKPKISEMSDSERQAAGLTRDTWRLEVIADPDGKARVRHPMTKADGSALSFDQLVEIGKTQAVSFLQVMTCNNVADPLGMGLWEGVPLRDIIWKTEPGDKVRRLHYHGFHRNDPQWMFRSSLSINRVFEDPPGSQPVILCYKLNGQWLAPDRGGPVRMLVPGVYGFKSVKWLSTIQLTSSHLNNDTYAEKGNDVDSRMKTYARILNWSEKVQSGEAIPLTGVAQCGDAGLSKVQYWLKPKSVSWPGEDRYFNTAPWQDARILPPPDGAWGDFPKGKALSPIPHQIGDNGKPLSWPLRHTVAHFAALLTGIPKGDYEIRVRTIDANGTAQPMPRPFRKSGGNAIQQLPLSVAG